MNGSEILVVEDEPAIQELIAVNLEHAGHRVRRAYNVAEAENLIREIRPDLILLDWMLPDVAGTVLARRLRADARMKDIPVIMLTARAQETDKVEGLEADDAIEIGGLRLDPASHRVSGNGTEISLGPTEFKLLHFFLTHPERVYSRVQLLDQVWGDHVFVEERTVDVHIRRLRQALEVTQHDSLIETVRGTGYRLHA